MKSHSPIPWSIAMLSIALLLPELAHAQNAPNAQSVPSTTSEASGIQEAMQMVPARAYLTKKLDAKEMKPGQEFRVTLSDSIQLKNGPKLPHGTVLVGTVVNDDMQMKGNAKLALRFTKADLKGGNQVPVKAMIVGVFAPQSTTEEGYDVAPGQQAPNTWNDQTLGIDQVNVISGVDLHSRAGGSNSGVFVTSNKDDVRISAGSELALAIAADGNSQAQASNRSGVRN